MREHGAISSMRLARLNTGVIADDSDHARRGTHPPRFNSMLEMQER